MTPIPTKNDEKWSDDEVQPRAGACRRRNRRFQRRSNAHDPAMTMKGPKGDMQVDAMGMTLYTWVKDKKKADATGDGFNKVWHAAKPWIS